jgi:UDP:flavonoid glycosyltransferase YjiC (YdhE family)
MKIGLQTWGSHGDIRPFLALAEGLQLAGHEVSLLITCVDSDAYDGLKSAAGVALRVLASPVLSPVESEQVGQTVFNTRNPMTQMAAILRLCFDPVEEAMFAAAQELAAESDLLIGHYFLHPLQIAAEYAGKPFISVLLSHAGVPSEFNHPLGLPLGRLGNRLLWWLTKLALNRPLLPYSNHLRARLRLKPVQDVVTQVWLSQPLTLVAVSPQICERQADWPPAIQVTGFLDMPNIQLEGRVPDNLMSFLAAGAAPVYLTFGSWMPKDVANQRETLQLLTEAVRQAECRAIIQSPGWQECGFSSCDQILYTTAAPHHLVFPHCQAVVHHGGAGTTQSATLAGKPSVVVAHISEQEHWGSELRRLGIAGEPIKRRSLTAKRLAQRLRFLQARPDMQARAQAIAAAMRPENGVAQAVRLINQTFSVPQRERA